MPNEIFLFSHGELSKTLEQEQSLLEAAVHEVPQQRLLATDAETLVQELADKFRLPTVTLGDLEIESTAEEPVDVRNLPNRYLSNPSRPTYVRETVVRVSCTFQGPAKFLTLRPNSGFSSGPPKVELRGNELHWGFPLSSAPDLNAAARGTRQAIQKWLSNVNQEVAQHNEALPARARSLLSSRRTRVSAERKKLASLEIPLKRRSTVPLSYDVPVKRRVLKPAPAPPVRPAAGEPYPTLPTEDYYVILETLIGALKMVERSPAVFAHLTEENLRDFLLVPLNGYFDGTATGETFNRVGKTDIMVRHEGKTLFVAECKFWKGPKSARDAIDQLLGYLTWRDTKTALIMFNRSKSGIAAVAPKLAAEVKNHQHFVESTPVQRERLSEQGLFFSQFSHPEDSTRRSLLATAVFDVPDRPKKGE